MRLPPETPQQLQRLGPQPGIAEDDGGWGQRVIEGARLGENSNKLNAIKNIYLTIEC